MTFREPNPSRIYRKSFGLASCKHMAASLAPEWFTFRHLSRMNDVCGITSTFAARCKCILDRHTSWFRRNELKGFHQYVKQRRKGCHLPIIECMNHLYPFHTFSWDIKEILHIQGKQNSKSFRNVWQRCPWHNLDLWIVWKQNLMKIEHEALWTVYATDVVTGGHKNDICWSAEWPYWLSQYLWFLFLDRCKCKYGTSCKA